MSSLLISLSHICKPKPKPTSLFLLPLPPPLPPPPTSLLLPLPPPLPPPPTTLLLLPLPPPLPPQPASPSASSAHLSPPSSPSQSPSAAVPSHPPQPPASPSDCLTDRSVLSQSLSLPHRLTPHSNFFFIFNSPTRPNRPTNPKPDQPEHMRFHRVLGRFSGAEIYNPISSGRVGFDPTPAQTDPCSPLVISVKRGEGEVEN